MRILKGLFCAALAVGLGACSDALEVENLNSPDADRALRRPADVEALISASYVTMWNNTHANHWAQLACSGMESYSNLANFAMSPRCAVPRGQIDNSRNAVGTAEAYGAYLALHRAARAASLGLNRVLDPTFTFFPTSVHQNNRAIAFANFVIGISIGQVAMMFDSGAAVSPSDDPSPNAPALPLAHYSALMTYALERLDTAIAYSETADWASTTPQTIPNTWMSINAPLSAAQFTAIIRGWKARLRAGVARSPAEAATVDWAAVIADATAFLAAYPGKHNNSATPGVELTMSRASTSPFSWGGFTTLYQSNSLNWSQVWGLQAVMASPQADADLWLSTPNATRQAYVVITPDRRWPVGATRTAQQAAQTHGGWYIENRALANDWFGDALGSSFYRHVRWLPMKQGIDAGQTVTHEPMPAAEIRLLAAEGQYMSGNFAAAAALVDVSRADTSFRRDTIPCTTGCATTPSATGRRGAGLPGLVANGVTNNTTLVPGGATCVPRVPNVAAGTSACGNLWEALKYEYRMETQLTGYGSWFTAGRRWGDLPAGTAVHWPVPYQEMDTRAQAFYGLSGAAAVGTYGI